ncbi:MAG: DUF268 domain-containing protein [Desulfuromonadaceae bacterium]|nr:DUF268 domain-containing protein [Desulfuromonadaceae bacterium]
MKYILDYCTFSRLKGKDRPYFRLNWSDRYPCLKDKTKSTGFDRHYVFHPAWAARILAETRPEYHIDISSSLYFCTLVSAFLPVQFYDYRPANLALSGLNSASADLLALPFPDNSVASLSCMHVVEHVGLGRYGDQIDPDGDLKAISQLKRVLAQGGNLLFVVPIGQPRIMFNAHRIYAYRQIIGYFSDLKLVEFSLIPDKSEDGGLIRNASQEQSDAQSYGCGCFWFRKESLTC